MIVINDDTRAVTEDAVGTVFVRYAEYVGVLVSGMMLERWQTNALFILDGAIILDGHNW